MTAEQTCLDLDAGAWEAIGVWVTGALTVVLLWFAYRQLKQSREVNDEATRPFIVVDFFFRSILISLSVRNTGQSAAKAVRVRLDERIASADGVINVAWQDTALFTDEVAIFAPGREMRFFLDTYPARSKTDLPMTITGTVEYQRLDGRGGVFVEPFVLDLKVYEHSSLAPKDIHEVAVELERIRRALEEQAKRPPPT